MRVVIAGGHGKIAMLLERLLADRGDGIVGLIRDPAQRDDVLQAGAAPVVCDLESATVDEVAVRLDLAEAVVFAAGAGPGSGAARKDTVDRDASVLLADAAELTGVRRFIQISAMGAGRPPHSGAGEVWSAYVRAKGEAEDDLRRRDLDWTILRPGKLTDDPPTGRVRLSESEPRSEIPRADVAAVLAELLRSAGTAHRTLELVSGKTPISKAVAAMEFI